ncbi:VOC family protein [Bacillus sp. UMB0893]|uniref:VOC family protein n=1 Tax=Bacillus sp. UMB0893 TaxID=2066053 RepID=UPI000C794A88|nr:VOC family protein [Bacillus sp. UMB0893]PLR66927.1 VOC family protein [Bacillus sp. UMB0893]
MKLAALYETHVETINLEKAIAFYQNLELELAAVIKERRAAFFWIGNPSNKEQMLGIWEVPAEKFTPSHFAFRLSYEELLKVPEFLSAKGIELSPAFGLDASEPVVYAWMQSARIYIKDPDNNSLEYITILEGKSNLQSGTVHLSKWLQMNAADNRR